MLIIIPASGSGDFNAVFGKFCKISQLALNNVNYLKRVLLAT